MRRIYLKKGKGKILVNNLKLDEYFGRKVAQMLVMQPLELVDLVEKVDINIHPTKTEIKFDDEKLIYSLVNSTIKKTLDKYNVSPSINFDADVNFLKEAVTNYDKKEHAFENKNEIKSLRGNDWDEIFENVRSENKTAKLFQEEEDQIINGTSAG